MDLWQALDGYCERIDAAYWSEPVNAVTNLSFIIAALIMWHRSKSQPMAQALAAIVFAIGVGSYLFHTHAQVWAAIADVTPIGLFILLYIFAINRDVWGLRPLWAFVLMLGFFPFAALLIPLWSGVPIYGTSAGYMPVPTLIVIYAGLLWRREPRLSRGMLWGTLILMLSLTARGLDEPLCEAIPLGTHFLWHLLNGLMLGWMIEIYRRHVAASQGPVTAL